MKRKIDPEAEIVAKAALLPDDKLRWVAMACQEMLRMRAHALAKKKVGSGVVRVPPIRSVAKGE